MATHGVVRLAAGGVWAALLLAVAHVVLFEFGVLWRVPTAAPENSRSYYLHAVRADVERLRAAPAPKLAVIGSSVVGPLSDQVLQAQTPGWSVVVVTAAGTGASDWPLLERWVNEAGADAVVLGTMWYDAVPPDATPREYVDYTHWLGHGPALWRYRQPIYWALMLAVRAPARPYPRHYRREIRAPETLDDWPQEDLQDYPKMHFARVLDTDSVCWAGVRGWRAAVGDRPAGVVLMPVNPTYVAAGLIPPDVPAGYGAALRRALPDLPLLDLSTTEPAARFRDGLHLQGADWEVSQRIGRWAWTAVLDGGGAAPAPR